MSYWGWFAAPLLRAASAGRARRFRRALDDVKGAQAAALQRIVRAATATQRGQALGLEDNTVAQRLSRARRQLQQWLQGGA